MDMVPTDPEQRFLLADAMLADSWRIAEAARRGLAGAPRRPPWERGREEDARSHRQVQRLLRQLLGTGR